MAAVPMLLGCGDASRPTEPSATPAASGVLASADQPHASASDRLVNIHDACDGPTFNAAVGPGTCIREGGVSFADFIAQLRRQGVAGAWHFAPSLTTAQLNQTLVAVDRGGEVHTFTHVAKFGGGIVPLLNQLSHNPVVGAGVHRARAGRLHRARWHVRPAHRCNWDAVVRVLHPSVDAADGSGAKLSSAESRRGPYAVAGYGPP